MELSEFKRAAAHVSRIKNSVTKFCWKRKLAKEAENFTINIVFELF
jgi:hypothetical protein